jgi:predicted component of type VI protein secretion system
LAKLEIVEGSSRGHSFSLAGKSIFEVGSARAVDVPLDDPEVAQVHFKLYITNGEFCAFDVSGRGFLHNGNRTLKTQLADGDMLKVGKSQLCFRAVTSPAANDAGALAPEPPRPPRPQGRCELLAIKGNDTGKTFDLRSKAVYVIGRGTATDITVWDVRVSRVHCRIDRDPSGHLITDLNASNGTYVNGQRIETHRLKAGDEIKLGSTVLQYVQA